MTARYAAPMSSFRVRTTRRGGFSLVEALVVLAVSGMALAIVFSIGTRAGEAGFALGRRALSAADQDLSTGVWRTLIESALLVPARLSEPGRAAPIVGTSDRIEAEAIMLRATPCAPRGWRGRLVLTLEETDEGGSALVCTGASGPVTVLDLGPGEARFTFSEDGQAWASAIDTGALDDRDRLAAPLELRRLFIRLDSPARGSLLAEAASGRPETWVRPDEFT